MRSQRAIKDYVLVLSFGLGLCVGGADYCATAEAADWPNWRGPNHNGVSEETGWVATWPTTGPKILWKASLGTGFATMAVSNGRVYAMGNVNDMDILYCLDANTGNEIWKQSYPCRLFRKNHEGGPTATPTVDGDAIYTFSKNADAIRFKASDGQIVWHKRLVRDLKIKNPTWYHSSSPLVLDNLIILNTGTRGVALNKSDGSVVWQNGKDVCGYASAVPFTIGNQTCVAMPVSREIVGLVAATGKLIWNLPWKTSYDINAADPIILGDKVFISSGYNKGCALLKMEAHGVTEIWRNKNMRNHASSCVLWEGHIYGFDGQFGGGGKLTCLHFETGKVKWAQRGMGTGTVMIADGKLIVLSEKGKLVIAEASPEKFNELASAQILSGKCWTMPVLANGRIYARNANGQLVCVDVSGKG